MKRDKYTPLLKEERIRGQGEVIRGIPYSYAPDDEGRKCRVRCASPATEQEVTMKTKIVRLLGLTLGVLLLLAPAPSFAKAKTGGAPIPKKVELKLGLRDLWGGHIFWVRNVVLETKYGDADAAKVAEAEAVQNAKDLANSISPYYGKEASDKLFGLLAGHYGAVKEYMTAAFSDNKDAKNAAVDKLKKNADEIAAFLSSANPNWPKDTLLSALIAHGGHHIAQIDAIAVKDFASEAKTWDAMKKHVNVIADVLADGIVKQFPGKFKK